MVIYSSVELPQQRMLSGLPDYAGARRVMISVGDTH